MAFEGLPEISSSADGATRRANAAEIERFNQCVLEVGGLGALHDRIKGWKAPEPGAVFCRSFVLESLESDLGVVWMDCSEDEWPNVLHVLFCLLPPCQRCEAHIIGPPMNQTVLSYAAYAAYRTRNAPRSTLTDFLSTFPPNRSALVRDVQWEQSQAPGPTVLPRVPPITFHCEDCGGDRLFDGKLLRSRAEDGINAVLLIYTCRNCRGRIVEMSVLISDKLADASYWVMKTGQFPPFGPVLTPRLQNLIQPDRELFLQGRRAESLGLGLGALTYYRRVVEDQRDRLLTKIRAAAVTLNAAPDLLARIDSALGNWKFSDSIDKVKDIIPERLMLGGHNPLSLLHNALSGAIHDLSDGECLSRARAIRVVLTKLAERLAEVTTDDNELREALAELHKTAQGDAEAPEAGAS